MTDAIEIHVCVVCGYAAFPSRIRCPVCGGRVWRNAPAVRGVLTGRTRLRLIRSEDVTIASLRAEQGPLVIVRLADTDTDDGAMLVLHLEDGVPTARLPSVGR